MTDGAKSEGAPRVVILGALSAIAQAAARLWANQEAHLVLAGRTAESLEALAARLREEGATAVTFVCDLASVDPEHTLASMVARLGEVDVVLIAYGVLGDQKLAEADLAKAQRILATNFTSVAGWCLAAANILERQAHGTLIVIGSVAGDRGRASNYIYGASKGGLAVLMQGLAHRLARTRASAILIKVGLVDTPMTSAIPKSGPLWVKPETVARKIVKAAKLPVHPVVYVPAFWRFVMCVIRFMPASLIHLTKL